MIKPLIDTHWDATFFRQSPLFAPVQQIAERFFSSADWPTLDGFQTAFIASQLDVLPVAQGDKPQCFDDYYESRIYLKGELQTRLNNWHDFFNALIWLAFPQTKHALNELHYQSSLQRPEKTNRSMLENLLTLFDECGAIVISDQPELLQLIRDHQWKTLFVEQRHCFDEHIQCRVFGHAMYEKALQPYVGMTCHALLIESRDLLQAGNAELDGVLAGQWLSGAIKSKKDLCPLPVLGVPGWYAENEQATFYDNTDYFRVRS